MDHINWRQVILWSLYDFANSIVVITFFLYFAQWLVIDHGVSDFWFNAIFVGGTVLLLLLAPLFGARADRSGKLMPQLRVTTLLMAVSLGITGIITAFFPQHVLLAAISFLLGNTVYQLSFVFYNPLLTQLGPENRWGTISGIGQAANWIGQIAGLIITLPLVTGAVHLFGAPGRSQPLLPAVILFFVLTLPMLIWFREETAAPSASAPEAIDTNWRSLIKLFAFPGVAVFVLAYFLFNDALLTMVNNLPIYLERVFGVSDTTKSLAMLVALATSALGGFAGGWISDRVGPRKTLLVILCLWVLQLPSLAFAPNFTIFAILMGVTGLLYGATWAVTRALLAGLLPPEQSAQGFSLYVLAERTASFAGPLTWGGAVAFLPMANHTNYRGAMLLMTVFVLAGLAIAIRLPRPSRA